MKDNVKELFEDFEKTEKIVAKTDNGFVIEKRGRFGKEFTCFFVNKIGCIDWMVYRTKESAVAQLEAV